MKRPVLFICALILAACNLPIAAPAAVTIEPAATIPIPATQTETLPPSATFTVIPPTSTATPIPCDPHTADYCITNGHLVFQRPILPPDNGKPDMSYLYASTQNGKRDAHHGIEFQNGFGTAVHAAGDGEVVFADADKTVKFAPWTNFYGNVIIIRHTGEVYTLYAHLSNILVLPGTQVKMGELIGQVGHSGGATGSHLHFEVRRGSAYTEYFSTENPELWFIPAQGMGALSITLVTGREKNYEHPLVISHYATGEDRIIFTQYISSYTKGFEHNPEDAALNNLPQGRYKIAFSDSSGLRERFVIVEAGLLTEVVFEVK